MLIATGLCLFPGPVSGDGWGSNVCTHTLQFIFISIQIENLSSPWHFNFQCNTREFILVFPLFKFVPPLSNCEEAGSHYSEIFTCLISPLVCNDSPFSSSLPSRMCPFTSLWHWIPVSLRVALLLLWGSNLQQWAASSVAPRRGLLTSLRLSHPSS